MRILCDHHVAPKYVQAFKAEEWIKVTTVEEARARPARADGRDTGDLRTC